MTAEGEDIVARVSSSPSSGGSLNALASYLTHSCGHVCLDARVVQQGYRFYPEMGEDIPAFFNKRFTTGSTSLAITLQAGFDLSGEDPLAGCTTTAQARAVIEGDTYEASLWLARITFGVSLLSVADIAASSFIAQHPNEFRLIAEELVALGIMQHSGCLLCSDDDALAPRRGDIDADAA